MDAIITTVPFSRVFYYIHFVSNLCFKFKLVIFVFFNNYQQNGRYSCNTNEISLSWITKIARFFKPQIYLSSSVVTSHAVWAVNTKQNDITRNQSIYDVIMPVVNHFTISFTYFSKSYCWFGNLTGILLFVYNLYTGPVVQTSFHLTTV